MLIIHWFVFYFDDAFLIRLRDVTKPTKWPLPFESLCKYSNAHNFNIFQPIEMKLVSKSMVRRALSYKTYKSSGLRYPINYVLKIGHHAYMSQCRI